MTNSTELSHEALATAEAQRCSALVAIGVPELYAKKFAADAEAAQAWHDSQAEDRGNLVPMRSEAEEMAKTIAAFTRNDSGEGNHHGYPKP